MKLRKSRERRRGRIEIIPMIDVMFFLLATFMLASLSMQNLNSQPVHLPEGRAAPLQGRHDVTLTVTRDDRLFLNHTPVTLASLPATLAPMLRGTDGSVILAGDSKASHGVVVDAMLAARQAGVKHFLIAVQQPN